MTIMAPRAAVVHVKIAGYDPSGWQRHTVRGGEERAFDLKRSLRILKQAGYDGPLNSSTTTPKRTSASASPRASPTPARYCRPSSRRAGGGASERPAGGAGGRGRRLKSRLWACGHQTRLRGFRPTRPDLLIHDQIRPPAAARAGGLRGA